jgi:hypothetical protein
MNYPSLTTKEIAKEASSVMKNLEPRFSSVYADAGVSCLLSCFEGKYSDQHCVGRAIDIVSHDKVIVNWCPMMDYVHFKRPPLSDESLRANVELYQGGTSDEVATSCISDLAYVFSQNTSQITMLICVA